MTSINNTNNILVFEMMQKAGGKINVRLLLVLDFVLLLYELTDTSSSKSGKSLSRLSSLMSKSLSSLGLLLAFSLITKYSNIKKKQETDKI